MLLQNRNNYNGAQLLPTQAGQSQAMGLSPLSSSQAPEPALLRGRRVSPGAPSELSGRPCPAVSTLLVMQPRLLALGWSREQRLVDLSSE